MPRLEHTELSMAKFLEIAAENPRGLTWEVMNLATHSGVAQGDATNLPLPYSDNQFFWCIFRTLYRTYIQIPRN